MIKGGLTAILIIILSACSNVKVDNDQFVNLKFSSIELSADIAEKMGKQDIYISNKKAELLATIKKKDHHYKIKTKGKQTLFSKKKFNIFPFTDSSQFINYAQENLFQDAIEGHDLIGMKSKFVNVHSKSNKSLWFFQEEVSAMLLEKRKRKDGIIFVYNEKAKIIHRPKHNKKLDTKDKARKIIESKLRKWKNKELATDRVFDLEKCGIFLAIQSAFHIQNQRIAYYLNPTSNLIEVFSYCSEKNADQLIDLVFQDRKINEQIYHFQKLQREKPKGYRIVECSKLEKFMPVLDWNTVLRSEDFIALEVPVLDSLLALKQKEITFKKQQIVLTKSLIIPSGFLLVVQAGQTIDLVQGASIISYSPASMMGNVNDPIKIYSSDSTGQGFHVINAKGPSELHYVRFKNLNTLSSDSWTLTGSVTFYESPVTITKCFFHEMFSEDNLNIVRSPFVVSNSDFSKSYSDALDIDYSTGKVSSCGFNVIGNDAIDIAGGVVEVYGCFLKNIEDKGISAGEESMVSVSHCQIINTSIALVSKDLSVMDVKKSGVNTTEAVFAVFQQKEGFGGGKITAELLDSKGYKEFDLVQEGSKLTVNGKKIHHYRKDVKKYLYGNEYGKKSNRE